MKKDNTETPKPPQARRSKLSGRLTVGMDLGDRSSRYCIVNERGEVVKSGSVATTKKDLTRVFGALPHSRVAVEVGTHSPWVSRQLRALGHEVVVGNPRRVRLIASSSKKSDELDAATLARLARVDPGLLYPIRHRGETAQADLSVIRARAGLVATRTALINSARGLSKAFGERLRRCDAKCVDVEMGAELPAALQPALGPLLEVIGILTQYIQEYDEALEEMAKERYPEVKLLTAVSGVGTLIALTFVLTLEDPQRFRRSRDVGCYLGMRPRRQQSGRSNPELGISKEGDPYLRQLLVQGAHYILGPHGPDCDLRRWGGKLAAGDSAGAKKRARIAVARKLSVLLHHLWLHGEVYEPLRASRTQAAAVPA